MCVQRSVYIPRTVSLSICIYRLQNITFIYLKMCWNELDLLAFFGSTEQKLSKIARHFTQQSSPFQLLIAISFEFHELTTVKYGIWDKWYMNDVYEYITNTSAHQVLCITICQ